MGARARDRDRPHINMSRKRKKRKENEESDDEEIMRGRCKNWDVGIGIITREPRGRGGERSRWVIEEKNLSGATGF